MDITSPADGRRFLAIKSSAEASTSAKFVVVQNYFEELKAKVSTK